jgi:hypothetical protein
VKRSRASNLNRGLVGAWCPSVSGSGLLLPDLSGYGNHGTLTNMDASDWVGTDRGRALDFDGVNDFVSISAARLPPGAAPWTISLWEFPTAFGAGNFGTSISWGSGSLYQSVILANNGSGGDGKILVGQYGRNVLTTTTARPLNQWTHTAIVYTGGTDLKAFQNGLLNGQGPISDAFNITVTAGAIGRFHEGTQRYTGQLDDIRLYNRALSPSEIKQLYEGGPGYGLRQERKRSRFQVQGFNAGRFRRQQLIGSGVY